MFQTSENLNAICQAWLAQVFSGKRAGKEFLFLQNKKLNDENIKVLAEYVEANYNEFVTPEILDKSVRYLSMSGRFSGQKVAPIDRDISSGAKSKNSSISLESGGGIQAILSKFFNSVQKVHDSRDKQEADRKKAFVALPRRPLTQKEMHAASAEQLREWNRWNNGSGEGQGGDLR